MKILYGAKFLLHEFDTRLRGACCPLQNVQGAFHVQMFSHQGQHIIFIISSEQFNRSLILAK